MSTAYEGIRVIDFTQIEQGPVGIPIKLSDTPGTLRLPPPLLGQHNEEILSSLGNSPTEIRSLEQDGIVGEPEQPAVREKGVG